MSNQSLYMYFGITNYYYNLKLTYTIVLFLYHAGRTNTIALFCCFTRFWYLLSLSTQMWCRRKYTRQGKNIIHIVYFYTFYVTFSRIITDIYQKYLLYTWVLTYFCFLYFLVWKNRQILCICPWWNWSKCFDIQVKNCIFLLLKKIRLWF